MGQIYFYFGGVCTFFDDYSSMIEDPASPPIHRMVLVNGDVSTLVFKGHSITILPHLALLTLTPPFVVEEGALPPRVPGTDDYSLNGGPGAYTISVANPLGPMAQPWMNNATCLPHLQASLPENVPLGPPSLPVIQDEDAACYVDFTYGRIDGFQVAATFGPMGISRAVVQTVGFPQLKIKSGLLEGSETRVTFETETVVVSLTNKASDFGDDPNDFLLNFLTALEPPLPSDVTAPGTVTCPPINGTTDPHLPERFQHFDAGPGCSNTNFP